MTKDFNQAALARGEGKRTNINLSELMSAEADHYVQQAKYVVNANQLEASAAEELMTLRREVKQDHRAAKESDWSGDAQQVLLSSLAKLKNCLDALGEDTHLKAAELFRKVRLERFGTLDQRDVDDKGIISEVGLIQLYTAEYDQYVLRLDYLVNSPILTPRRIEKLTQARNQLQTSYRLAVEANWSEATLITFGTDLTVVKSALSGIDEKTLSAMIELYQSRKQKPEGNENAE